MVLQWGKSNSTSLHTSTVYILILFTVLTHLIQTELKKCLSHFFRFIFITKTRYIYVCVCILKLIYQVRSLIGLVAYQFRLCIVRRHRRFLETGPFFKTDTITTNNSC